MNNVISIRRCRVCEKTQADPLKAPFHLINTNGTLVLLDVYGEVVCPVCRAHWRRERSLPASAG